MEGYAGCARGCVGNAHGMQTGALGAGRGSVAIYVMFTVNPRTKNLDFRGFDSVSLSLPLSLSLYIYIYIYIYIHTHIYTHKEASAQRADTLLRVERGDRDARAPAAAGRALRRLGLLLFIVLFVSRLLFLVLNIPMDHSQTNRVPNFYLWTHISLVWIVPNFIILT